jgi:hypothetical protein
VSSATRNDAASQREPPSTYYINGNNILDGNAATAATLAAVPPVEITMSLFLSRGFGDNIKAGFNIVSPNVKPNSKDVLFTYPSTNISCDNVFNKRIYLDKILTDFLTCDVIVKKKFSGELFTIMALKFSQILGSEGGHYPGVDNVLGTPANGYFVNGIWSYKPIVPNDPNNYYDNMIRDCIQYDVNRTAGFVLLNNQKPLNIFLNIFNPLISTAEIKYLAKIKKGTKVSIPSLNLNVIFRTIADNLNTFFTSEFTGQAQANKVPLSVIEANEKFNAFHRYLEFILSPWIDERECRVFDNDLNIDYSSFGIMAGGGVTNGASRNTDVDNQKRKDLINQQREESRVKIAEVAEAAEAKKEATTTVTQYLTHNPDSIQFNGNINSDVIGSYGIFLYKDGIIPIKTEKQYKAVLSLVNCAEGYNPFYVEPQMEVVVGPVPGQNMAAANNGQGQGQGQGNDPNLGNGDGQGQGQGENYLGFIGSPSNKKRKPSDIPVTPPSFKTLGFTGENRDALRNLALKRPKDPSNIISDKRFISEIENNSNNKKKSKIVTMRDILETRDDSLINYRRNPQFVTSSTGEQTNKRNRFDGGKRTTRKRKYSTRKPIRRKTMKKRIHKRKTRKNI